MTIPFSDTPPDGVRRSASGAAVPGEPFQLTPDEQADIEQALEKLPISDGWRVEHLALKQLQREGNASASRLLLWVAVYLHDPAAGQRAQLDLTLASSRWRPSHLLPPFGAEPSFSDEERAAAVAASSAPLCFTLTGIRPRPASDSRATWLHYLDTPGGWRHTVHSDQPLTNQLAGILNAWLRDVLALDTAAGAQEALLEGPVGHFGALESCVLERSGQADLAVEATLLGSADDGPEHGGEASIFLDLYGERLGLWLLHRRTLQPSKVAKREGAVPRQWHCTVLIAATAEALVAQTELTPAEKRLFHGAGVLPHATLWPERSSVSAGDGPVQDQATGAAGSAATTALDLSAIADRPRRHLQAIAQLAQRGELDATDVDLLLKMSRQLAKAKDARKTAPAASARRIPRR